MEPILMESILMESILMDGGADLDKREVPISINVEERWLLPPDVLTGGDCPDNLIDPANLQHSTPLHPHSTTHHRNTSRGDTAE
jgi:hypothetical protein